jgi:gliding motility-associated-like protein
MKILSTILFFNLFFFGLNAQKWGANTFSQFTNEALDVEIDNAGNSYITGYVTGETAFNTNNVIQNAAGNGDIYVAKYNPVGTLVWYKKFGGNYSDRAYDLAIGPDQNIVVTGQFFGSITFGSTTLQSALDSKDIFLLKLDPNGDVIWALKEGGSMAENAYGVTVDHQNNVILTGQFQGNATIAGSNFTSVIDPITNLPSFDLFVSKYNPSGNSIWVRVGAAEKEDRGLAVAVDSQDNIFVTGQYSDTLIFAGNIYNNNGYNVGFVTKISPSGQVQFFNNLRAGFVLPYDVEVNSSDKVVITGDFLGNMNYYHNNVPYSIQSPYSKKIFVLKIENDGSYQWNYTLGSESDISAASISVDLANSIFVTGFFSCALNQLHDTIPAFWNSVGFKDPYVLKVSDSGTFVYAKQMGGKLDDEGLGIAIQSPDKPILCGSYTLPMNVTPTNSAVLSGTNNYQLRSFGSEVGQYYFTGDSTRNSFILKYLDGNYQKYRYYQQQTADSLVGEIAQGQDTIHFCSGETIGYNPLTYSFYGPSYNYIWNTGSIASSIIVTSTGDYSVLVTRTDGCASDLDSIHMISDPIPELPLLSDDVIIYTNQTSEPSGHYGNYNFCFPETIAINYTNLAAGTTMQTTEPNGNVIPGTGPNNHSLEGTYSVMVDNGMCQNTADFHINLDYVVNQTPIELGISSTNSFINDTLRICDNYYVNFFGYDIITNPNAVYGPLQQPILSSTFTINGQFASNSNVAIFNPSSTGNYLVEYDLIVGYSNLCGLDTTHYHVEKLYYIEILPLPNFSTTISGDNVICQNGSIFLVLSNTNPSLNWSGPGISWQSSDEDSIEINLPGQYTYSGTIVDPISGCQKAVSFSKTITLKTAPNIVSNPTDGIICPNDTAYLSLPNVYQTYQWVGPNGDTISDLNTCEGSIQGFYYCHVLDNQGCFLTTPPFELKEFTTPSISVFPQDFLCANEQITISVNYTGTPVFQWSPISSNTNELIISQPGNYSVSIQQCGITTTESVTIIDASFTPVISTSSSVLCFGDEISILGTPNNATYEWINGEYSSGALTVNQAGSYNATVTNEFGCVAQTNTIVITQVAGSFPPPMDSVIICAGSDVNLVDYSPYTLNWYDLDTNFLQTTSNLLLSNIESDTSFLIAYAVQFCAPTFKNILIDVIDSISNYSLISDTMMCLGEIVTMHFQHAPTTNFQWFNGISNNDYAAVNQPGVYTISIQECGFQIVDSIEIYDANTETILLANDTLICNGEVITIVVEPANSINVIWNSLSVNTDTLEVTAPGIYFATVTNAYGCIDQSDTISISYDPLTAIPFVRDTIICSGSNVSVQDTSFHLINWYTTDTLLIATSNQFDILGLTDDTSFIYSQASQVCDLTFQTFNIHVIDSIPDLEIMGDSILCPNESTILTINSADSISWLVSNIFMGNSNQISLNQSNLADTTSIIVSVFNQCFSRFLFDTIYTVLPDTISFESDTVILCNYDEIPYTTVEDVLNLTWSGSFGNLDSLFLVLTPDLGGGLISCTGIDLNGCVTNTIDLLLVNSNLDYTFQVNSGNLCEGNPGFVEVLTDSDSLIWHTPFGIVDTSFISIISNQTFSGIYNLTIWDTNFCHYDSSIVIDFNPLPAFTLNSDTLLCLNDIYTYLFPSDTIDYSWSLFGSVNDIPVIGNQELILTATSPAGCVFVDTIYVMSVDCDDALPNVITSNGDGTNDYFVIDEAPIFPNNHLYLYNRWGNVIFEQEGYQNTFEGSQFSEGVYWYVFYQDPINNPKKVKQGFLHIYH